MKRKKATPLKTKHLVILRLGYAQVAESIKSLKPHVARHRRQGEDSRRAVVKLGATLQLRSRVYGS